jgi:hypothetical protein
MEKRIEQLIHCTTGDITSRSKRQNCYNLHPIQDRERERGRKKERSKSGTECQVIAITNT